MTREEFIKRCKQIVSMKYVPIDESAGDLWDDLQREAMQESIKRGMADAAAGRTERLDWLTAEDVEEPPWFPVDESMPRDFNEYD